MKKQLSILMAISLLSILLSACGKSTQAERPFATPSVLVQPTSASANQMTAIPQTGWTQAVPAAYQRASDQPGTVVPLSYDTLDYVRRSAPITKTAYVYLPYGYDENDTETRYNILYLMHGWGGHAGEYFEFATIKNMFDNLIANGDIPPLIIVSASFYNENSDTDFSGSIEEFRAFHLDFENALMPAVERKYHTYALSASDEDLRASRDHRAFGGFSLGSVTTWLEVCHDADYIRWFLPMSGSCWYYGTYGDFQFQNNVDFLEQLVLGNDLDERGLFIYHAVGTNDAVKYQSIGMAEETMTRDVFTPDHYVFYQKDGGYHDFYAVQEYLYNALPLFFREENQGEVFTAETSIDEVRNYPAFGNWGRLIFPVDEGYYSGRTLGDLSLTWYSEIRPEKTVEICNYFKSYAEAGETVFYPIYTEEEMTAEASKRDTGLFFFRGEPGAKVAICNAGGGMAYVGAMHDSFPHALELSRMGYNAFALIYRPGYDTAPADLARAIAFLHEHAEELQVDMTDYSLWGGSAGARMAAWLGSYRTSDFGEKEYPRPAAVIMQYTGLSEVYGNEPPTYACVGTRDGIASWRTMQRRIEAIRANGTDTMIEVFDGLSHGFGIGTGTVAEGWINNAVDFWERNMHS